MWFGISDGRIVLLLIRPTHLNDIRITVSALFMDADKSPRHHYKWLNLYPCEETIPYTFRDGTPYRDHFLK